MSNIYDKSSLVLIPSGTKTGKVFSQKPTNGDGDFTFTRSSAATRVNADGNIEKETENRLLQSNTFNTWISNNTSETSGQSGYDGTNDAWLLAKGAASAYMYVNNTVSGVQTFSVYAKSGSLSWMRIVILGGSDFADAFFNLADGSLGANSGLISGSSESVTGGWYRYSITINGSPSQVRIYPADFNGNVSGTSGNILIQDSQREQGLVARDYIETTTSAVYGGITDNVPRLDYTDSSCPALLLEPLRTNNVTNSEYHQGTIAAVTRTYNTSDTLSPEGVYNAVKYEVNANNSDPYLRLFNIPTSGNSATFSLYVKGASGQLFSMILGRDGYNELEYEAFTLDGTWQRLDISKTFTTTPTTLTIGAEFSHSSNDGVLGQEYYLYGLQVEAASYATSYIPTYGSSVSRIKEICEVTSAEDLIGQTEGTIAGEFNYDSGEPTNRLFSITGSDWNSDGSIRFDIISLKPQATIRSNGGEPAKIIGTQDINVGSLVKFAVVYTSTTLKMFVNGAQIGSTATLTGSLPSTLDEIRINALGGNFVSDTQNNQLNPYKQALVFKTALTDQEAIDLTTL